MIWRHCRSKTRDLFRLSGQTLRLTTGILTGHSQLNRPTSRGVINGPTCSYCEGPQTEPISNVNVVTHSAMMGQWDLGKILFTPFSSWVGPVWFIQISQIRHTTMSTSGEDLQAHSAVSVYRANKPCPFSNVMDWFLRDRSDDCDVWLYTVSHAGHKLHIYLPTLCFLLAPILLPLSKPPSVLRYSLLFPLKH